MSELLLIRHGQASFDKAHYDELSPVGHRQATLLGEWMAARGMEFDAVTCGTMERHRDTLAAIVHAYGARRLRLPTARMVESINEYEHRNILAAFARHHPAHPAVEASEAGSSRDPRRLFDFLRAALGTWATGALDADVLETWAGFRARIGAAAQDLAALARQHRRVLVVSSGGVISQLAQHALDCPDARAVELNLSLRNSAMCELRAVDGRFLLSSWNGLPHLSAPGLRELWTYY
jgi:broad specificity phosphatase PhoE